MLKRFLFVFISLSSALTWAAPAVDYSGNLRNGGVPFDGVVELTFSIYDGNDPQNPIWTEVHGDVVVTDGRFTVPLFSQQDVSASDLNLDVLRLGIRIDGGPELMPRQRLPAVARARVATTSSASTPGCSHSVGNIGDQNRSLRQRLYKPCRYRGRTAQDNTEDSRQKLVRIRGSAPRLHRTNIMC